MFIVTKWELFTSTARLFSTLADAIYYVNSHKKLWPNCAFYVKKINDPLFIATSFIQTY